MKTEDKVLPGQGIRMAQLGDRVLVGRRSRPDFAHPWSVFNASYRSWTEPGTDGAKANKEGWTLQILPGFVNGVDPLAYGVMAEGTANGGRRYNARGKGSALNRIGGAAAEFGRIQFGEGDNNVTDEADRPDWYPLLQGPVIPVNAFTANSGRPVPAFFRQLGVQAATRGLDQALVINPVGVQLNLTAAAARTAAGETGPAPRQLLAQDFWVARARASYRPEVTVEGNLVTGQLVTYNLSFDTGRVAQTGDRPRIYQGSYAALEAARRAQTELGNRLAAGGPQDDGEDRQLLFTFWLLEPPPLPDGRPPSFGDWIPYVEYAPAGWWNLTHRARNEPPIDFGRFWSGLGSLGAFLGRYTVVPQATLGALNAESNRILNAVFNETSNEGRFWT